MRKSINKTWSNKKSNGLNEDRDQKMKRVLWEEEKGEEGIVKRKRRM